MLDQLRHEEGQIQVNDQAKTEDQKKTQVIDPRTRLWRTQMIFGVGASVLAFVRQVWDFAKDLR